MPRGAPCPWHPIASPADEVLAWRVFLEARGIVQPFKQAHRETYTLTDAERATGTYSNRFAAHVLRQHQLAALAQERGWAYHLQGGTAPTGTTTPSAKWGWWPRGGRNCSPASCRASPSPTGRRSRIAASALHPPFEDDTQLAVILRKAFLLAQDREINDATIRRQIG